MKATTSILVIVAAILSGCANNSPFVKNETPAPTASANANTTTVATPTPTAPSDRKEVKGLGDWSGYVQGKPAPKSKFTKLEIGMSRKEVTDLVGQPTDHGATTTLKAYIPFFGGSGVAQSVYYYKGRGRLIFSSGPNSIVNFFLVGIEHDATEHGYKQ